MLRFLFVIFFLCVLVVVSVMFAYRARAAMSECAPRTPCIRDVKPPDCEVAHPLLARDTPAWRERMIANVIRCPQPLCIVEMKCEPLQQVTRVSTLDILRAVGR